MKKPAILVGAIALCLACAILAAPAAWLRGTPPPSIVLIVLDTVRADHLSAYGYPRRTSPHLEKLAAEGALFERAFSSAPWTPPSHASLFTGLLPYEHGCQSGHCYLSDEQVTIAELLRADGYATGGFSANVNISRRAGFGQGFDEFGEMWRRPEFMEWMACGRQSNAAALDWIDGLPDGKPFFLFINHMEAHMPYDPPPPERNAPIGGMDFLDPALDPELVKLYDGELLYLDRIVRELCEALDKRGLLDECLLVITSDHGELLGEDGYVGHMLSIDDILLRVPLILRWPGKVAGGRAVAEPVTLMGLFKTLVDVAGGSQVAVEGLVRNSAGPALAEYYPPVEINAELEAAIQQDHPEVLTGLRAIRMTEQGHEHKHVEGFDGTWALDGLGTDPEASRRHSERLQAVMAGLDPYREPSKIDPIRVTTEDADDRAMRGLGYLSGTSQVPERSFHAGEHRRRGELFFKRGMLEEAVADFRRACWLDPGELRARFGLARALDLLGDPSALPVYQAFLKLADWVEGQEDRVRLARSRVAELATR